MVKAFLKVSSFLFNSGVFIILSILIFKLIWNYLGIEYIYGNQPVGGDYFNGLTYQLFFSKNQPNPATGWLPFWNEGTPVIGGYPSLSFYLTNLLTPLFDVATSMNIFSIVSLALFLIFSLLVFWQVAKNWFIATALTAILFATRATYYQLTTGGFIASASAQWYLPLILFFIYKFHDSKNPRFLLLASFFSGLSLVQHSATSALMIFAPSFLILSSLPFEGINLKKRLSYSLIFIIFSFLIGASGIYSAYLQNFQGAGTDACASSQCWGIYPKHLQLWLTFLSLFPLATLAMLVLILKLFKKRVQFNFLIPSTLAFGIFVIYALAAYFKLINGVTNVIPPTRTFWIANFFLLLISATAFYAIQKISLKIAYPISLIIATLTLFYVYKHQPNIHKSILNTVPLKAASYIPGKYQSKNLSEIVPDWLPTNELNWRVDILNQGITQWWNSVSQTPQVRGYSNNPLGIHRDWQYFLQTATRGNVKKDSDKEISYNEALFLIDAYGIKFFENSLLAYQDSITKNPQIIVNKDTETFWIGKYGKIFSPKSLQWYQLSDEITTPVISPTNTIPILFVGNNKGYELFIRTIAMTNSNSSILIPVRGPKSINQITKEELETFPAFLLYQIPQLDLNKLTDYVQKGGKIFIDTGPSKFKTDKASDLLPFESLTYKDIKGSLAGQKIADDLKDNVDIQKFSEFSFEKGLWNLSTSKSRQLKPWAKEFLEYQNSPVIAGGKFGNGYIIWSGLNLPFHIIANHNFEEAKLFRNILNKLIEPQTSAPLNSTVERPKPELIWVQGKNFNGIYFKENYDPGWKAQAGNKTLTVYKAGLGFMYIPTNKTGSNNTIFLKFQGSFITWGILILTLISSLMLLILIIIPHPLIYSYYKTRNLIKNKIGKKFKKWTDNEV